MGVYRYIDWSITVPLQMIEFNLILKAAKAPISTGGFWRLLVGTVLMLVFGYIGETTPGFGWPGFILGLCGWAFILFEIFAGESSKASANCSGAVKKSFANMRLIVSLGWCIYPLGYFLGFLTGMATRPPSTWCTTLLIFSTRLALCLLAGPAPRRTARRMASLLEALSFGKPAFHFL